MKKDVELVIRARDEASRATNGIAETLDRLTKSANNAGKGSVEAGSKIDTLGAALGKIQSDYKAIDAAVTSADVAFKRQNATLDESRAQQQAVAVQTAAAKASLERLKAETVAEGDAQVAHAAKVKLVEAAYAALVRQNNTLTTSVERQEVALQDAGLAMQRLGSQATAAEIGLVQAALQRSVGVTKELSAATAAQTEKYREQAREARAAEAAQDAQRGFNTLAGMNPGMPKSASSSAAVFEEHLRLQEQQASAAARIKAQLAPLAAAQDRYNVEVAEANALYSAGLLKADELAAHLRHLEAQAKLTGKALTTPGGGARGNKSALSLFGLKPYEIQNLAYQINDLLTQVASGTPITQAFAQQGGQIAQIFAGANGGQFFSTLISGATRALPIIGVVVTALVAVGAALKNIGDLSASTRGFGGLLGASADGGLYNAKDLAATAHELDVLSGSLKEARSQVSALVKAGVSEAFLQPMAEGAQRMAKIYGIDVVEATKQAGEAFTGGLVEIQALDKATNAFTKTQMDHIKRLIEEGKASEARNYAFGIWAGKMNAGATDMEGRWAKAMRTFAKLWDFVLGKIGDTGPIRSILGWIDKMITALDVGLAKLARLKGGSALARAETQQVDLQAELARSREYNTPAASARRARQDRARMGAAMGGTGPSLGSLIPATPRPRSEAAIQADITANEARRKALLGGTTDPRAAGSEQGAKEDADRAEKADKKAAAAARKAEREAAAAASARESAVDALHSALGSLSAQADKVTMAPLDERLKAVEQQTAAARKALDDARKLGVTSIDGRSLEAAEKEIDANKVILQQQVRKTFYAEVIKNFETQRAERIKTINDLVAEGAITDAEAAKRLDALDAELAPQMADMARNALLFAMALRTATPNPELEKFIAQMQRTLGRETTPGGKGSETSAAKLDRIAANQQHINDLIAQRNDLIQVAQELADRGAISYEEMQARIKKAYEDTTPAIDKHRESILDVLNSLNAAREIDPAAYDAWIAKLKEVSLGTENLHDQLLSVADANSMLVDAGVGLWDRFFAAIEKGKNVLTAFWDSLRSTVADVLADLARMIVKAMLIRAVMSSKAGKWLSDVLGTGSFDTAGAIASAGALTAAGGVLNAAAAALMAAAKALAAAMAGGGGGSTGGSAGGSLLSTGLKFLSSVISRGGGFVNSLISAFVRHDGGMAGGVGVKRFEPASLWQNVQRLHSGGMPGLRSGEVRTILEDTEEVLTRKDPRHVLNGGRSAGDGRISVKNVNVFDSADMLDKAIATERGQRVVLNFISQNPGAVKAALGLS